MIKYSIKIKFQYIISRYPKKYMHNSVTNILYKSRVWLV